MEILRDRSAKKLWLSQRKYIEDYVPELRKNLISLGTLQANGYSFKSDGDKETLKVSKGAMTMMKARRTPGNIYNLLGCTIVGDIASVESAAEATRLWHMRLGHLSEK